MAVKRMVNRSIAVSKQVNQLTDKQAIIFTWGIPFTDDFGRIDKDAEVLKATVVPMRKDITEKDCADTGKRCCELGLWEELSDCYLYTGFDNHQSISEAKKAKSKFEALPLKGSKPRKPDTKEKKPEPKKEEPQKPVSEPVKVSVYDKIFDAYEEIFGRKLKSRKNDRKRKIKERLETFTPEELIQSFKGATQDNYIMGKSDKNTTFYATIDYLTRNDAIVEKYLDTRTSDKIYMIENKVVSKEEYEEYKKAIAK